MLISIIELDYQIFEWINTGLANPVFDAMLPWIRNKYVWLPLYIFVAGFLILNFKKRGYWFFLMLLVCVGLADATSSRVLKPWVERPRPCHESTKHDFALELRVHCGSGYSFTSSHAANHFAIAAFIFLAVRRKWKVVGIAFLVWAGLISFAQVYVGVHFPIDIFTGAILGCLIASLCYRVFNRHFQRIVL